MAKVKVEYFGINMTAEGKSEFVDKQTAAFLGYMTGDKVRIDTEFVPCPLEKLTGVERDVVAIYDDAGIPSIMHRFRRVTDKELFDGSDKVHPAFVIGGEVYDEIFISVYPNTMINGKPYSLPGAVPATNISMEDFAQACFSKGEGWHSLTAAEWGLLANTSLKLGTLPHGNTNGGSWHENREEAGTPVGKGCMTLTGTGPATWTHDHTKTGVHDLCGNIWELVRGMRIKNGALQAAKDNDAALPETNLTECGDGWEPITDNDGKPLYASVDGRIAITADTGFHADYDGCKWGDVVMKCESERLKELAFFAGEPNAYCYIDSTEGEYILFRGGRWSYGASAGVFNSYLAYPRSYVGSNIGGRSAYFKKH